MPHSDRERPTTAQELFTMHPSIGVKRERTGSIEVYPFRDIPSPFIGFSTQIILSHERDEAVPVQLAIVSYLTGRVFDTELHFSYPGSIHTPVEVTQRTTAPELVIAMATAGIDLLDGYVSLSQAEREHLPAIPYGNEKVYDFGQDIALESSATFIIARELLLSEPLADT